MIDFLQVVNLGRLSLSVGDRIFRHIEKTKIMYSNSNYQILYTFMIILKIRLNYYLTNK